MTATLGSRSFRVAATSFGILNKIFIRLPLAEDQPLHLRIFSAVIGGPKLVEMLRRPVVLNIYSQQHQKDESRRAEWQ